MGDFMYFDYASTTPLLPNVKNIIKNNLDNFVNPSNEYNIGLSNKNLINNVKNKILDRINGNGSIYFTSCGSESNTWAIIGTVIENDIKAIITSKIEHESILNSCDFLTSFGVDVYYLNVDEHGNYNEKEYRNLLKLCKKYKDKVLVSLMLVNNEIGTIENISYFSKLAHSYDYIFHTDAVQALGHIIIDNSLLCANLISFSGHKIGCPKGIGALFVDENTSISPIIFGGKQEDGIRGGTENILGILSFGEAINYYTNEKIEENRKYYFELNKILFNELDKNNIKYLVNNNNFEEINSPNIISLTFPGTYGDSLATYLDDYYNIQVSVGSACSYGLDVSHVLKAITSNEKIHYDTIRISLGEDIKPKDIKTLVKSIKSGIDFLKKIC